MRRPWSRVWDGSAASLLCSIIHSPFLQAQEVNPGGACHTRKAALWRQLHIIIIIIIFFSWWFVKHYLSSLSSHEAGGVGKGAWRIMRSCLLPGRQLEEKVGVVGVGRMDGESLQFWGLSPPPL